LYWRFKILDRKRRESAKYFNKYKEILEDVFEIGKERKRLGFINVVVDIFRFGKKIPRVYHTR